MCQSASIVENLTPRANSQSLDFLGDRLVDRALYWIILLNIERSILCDTLSHLGGGRCSVPRATVGDVRTGRAGYGKAGAVARPGLSDIEGLHRAPQP